MNEVEEKEEKLQVFIEPLAYKKIVYHLIRYPTSKVTGALIGKEGRKITNAYPLFHTPLVNPTFSVALDLIESNLAEGQQIMGFYQFVEGNEFKVSSMIQNNANMKNMISMRIWMNTDKEIRMGSSRFNFQSPAFSSLEEGLKRGEYRFLVDMDAHLQEVELDFRNGYLS